MSGPGESSVKKDSEGLDDTFRQVRFPCSSPPSLPFLPTYLSLLSGIPLSGRGGGTLIFTNPARVLQSFMQGYIGELYKAIAYDKVRPY